MILLHVKMHFRFFLIRATEKTMKNSIGSNSCEHVKNVYQNYGEIFFEIDVI